MRFLRFGALTVGLALLVGVTLTGCGGGGDNKPSADGGAKPGDDSEKATVVLPGKGTLKGVAKIELSDADIEQLKKAAQANMDKLIQEKGGDAVKNCIHDVPKDDVQAKEQQKWRIGKDHGVKDVLVWLKPANRSTLFGVPNSDPVLKEVKEGKDKEVTVDQPFCAFEPHVFVMFTDYFDESGKRQKTKQTLRIKNSAAFAHNTKIDNSTIGITGFNENAPKEGKVFHTVKAPAKAKPAEINCNIHPQMKAFFLVMDNPYYAVTDKDGNYEIKDVPKGKVRLFAWKEGAANNGYLFGEDGKEIELKDGENTENLKIKPE